MTTIPSLPDEISDSEVDTYFDRIVNEPIDELASLVDPDVSKFNSLGDQKFKEFFSEIGPDLAIVAYMFTPAQLIDGEFQPVSNVGLSNLLNSKLFTRFSMLQFKKGVKHPELFLSSTRYTEKSHGESFLADLKESMGVEGKGPVDALVTTNMNPWLIRTPELDLGDQKIFKRGDMISKLLLILDRGVKETMLEIRD